MNPDSSIVGLDTRKWRGERGWVDITGIDDVEILIRHDGKVVWINGPTCRVRICGIRGEIIIRRF